MTATASELASLRAVAVQLGPPGDHVVFIGGMIRSLLVTDSGALSARPTDDIDLVAAIASQAEYYAFAEKLRVLGFREDRREGAPLCRWLVDGLTVDVMPDHPSVLGFLNRWYSSALVTAWWGVIGDQPEDHIRVVDAPHFIATKLDSFRGRAEGDLFHHDMEDIVAVVDGRSELLSELKAAPDDVRGFVAKEITTLMNENAFREALSGHLPGDKASQARLPSLEQRLRELARC